MNSFQLSLLFGAVSLRLAADPISPDPSDSYFRRIQVDTVVEPGTAVSATPTWVALSGDGNTAILNSTRIIETIAPPVPSQPYVRVINEYVVRDGAVSLLTHWATAEPFKTNSPTETGPRWTTSSLPFDGRFVTTTKAAGTHSYPEAYTLALPDQVPVLCPLSTVYKVSADGGTFVGLDTSDQLVRVQTSTARADVIIPIAISFTTKVSIFDISDDGEVVLGSTLYYPNFLWSKKEGMWDVFSLVGPNVLVNTIDGSGRLLAGGLVDGAVNHPFFWTKSGGIVRLTQKLNGVTSSSGKVDHVSGDGSLLFGSLQFPTGQVAVVWQRDGTIYSLESLIRGVDTHGILWTSAPSAVSRDGRTIVGRGTSPTEGTLAYMARIAFPGEGPRLRFKAPVSGTVPMTFQAKTGYRYQVQKATRPDVWTSVGAEIAGDDADHDLTLPLPAPAPAFYRVLLLP